MVTLQFNKQKYISSETFLDAASVKMENCIQPVFSDSSSLSTERFCHNNTVVALDIPQTKKSEINEINTPAVDTTRSKMKDSRSPKKQSVAVNTSVRCEKTAEKFTQSQCDNFDGFFVNNYKENIITNTEVRLFF